MSVKSVTSGCLKHGVISAHLPAGISMLPPVNPRQKEQSMPSEDTVATRCWNCIPRDRGLVIAEKKESKTLYAFRCECNLNPYYKNYPLWTADREKEFEKLKGLPVYVPRSDGRDIVAED